MLGDLLSHQSVSFRIHVPSLCFLISGMAVSGVRQREHRGKPGWDLIESRIDSVMAAVEKYQKVATLPRLCAVSVFSTATMTRP
jgi:hypothetical protein